ncbi:MAG: LysM peptidoglycan-binding domain-containing protein [Anaerolineales bacterium]|nr:LysM peptidoglycan-binding domain-containing protein [Anaerolineales bacterium]
MKKKLNHTKLLLGIAALSLAMLFCTVGETPPAEETPAPTTSLTAILSELQGVVQMQKAGGTIQDAVVGAAVEQQDIVLTQADSRARLDLSNGTIVRVGPMSQFTLESVEVRPDGAYARVKLTIGKLWIILNGGSMEIDTPSGLASVRGSYMHVWVDEETGEVVITCLEGECAMGNEAGTMTMHAGEMMSVTNSNTMPQMGQMSDEEVNEWLQTNPEATLVVLPLTATAENTATPTTAGECSPPSGWVPYSVQSGDNFINLAVKYGITPAELASKNCLNESSGLAVGMPLYVPGSTPKPELTATRTPTATEVCGPPNGWDDDYVVKKGDTLFAIATLYQTNVAALQQANCLGSSTTIVGGQRLFVPNNATITPTKTDAPTKTKTSEATKTPDPSTQFANQNPASGATIGCTEEFKVKVTDIDGILSVYVEFSLNDKFDSPLDIGVNESLLGDMYMFGVDFTGYPIVGPDEPIYWRYIAVDGKENTTTFKPGKFFLSCPTPNPDVN